MDQELSLNHEWVSTETTDEKISDADIAKQIANGDTQAWNQFFTRYSVWVYRFAYYHLNRNHADAEDLCSDILLAAAKSIHNYDPVRGSMDFWMLGLAKHRLYRFCKMRSREIPFIPEFAESGSWESMDDMSSMMEMIVVKDAVNEVLSVIPERHATALVGKYVDGYTTEELARIQNTTPKAMESLLTRARNSFKAVFNDLQNTGRRRPKHE